MSDLISRQNAIKTIEDLPNCYNGFSDTYDKACIIGTLEEVPSAQLERPEQPESAKEYCAECDHTEMCQWYPYEGCEWLSESIQPGGEP